MRWIHEGIFLWVPDQVAKKREARGLAAATSFSFLLFSSLASAVPPGTYLTSLEGAHSTSRALFSHASDALQTILGLLIFHVNEFFHEFFARLETTRTQRGKFFHSRTSVSLTSARLSVD